MLLNWGSFLGRNYTLWNIFVIYISLCLLCLSCISSSSLKILNLLNFESLSLLCPCPCPDLLQSSHWAPRLERADLTTSIHPPHWFTGNKSEMDRSVLRDLKYPAWVSRCDLSEPPPPTELEPWEEQGTVLLIMYFTVYVLRISLCQEPIGCVTLLIKS